MDIGSILLILALLILVGLFISRPLVERKEVKITSEDIQEDHEYSALLAERDRILDSLEEIDFDYALGKIPEPDYPGQRNALLQRGADTLRALDKLAAQASEEDAEARLESTIAARRSAVEGQTLTQPTGRTTAAAGSSSARAATLLIEDDELEAQIAARRRARSDKSAGFCPQCGNAVTKSDKFCSKCGTTIT